MAERASKPAPYVVAVLSDLNSSYGSTTYRADVHAAVDALVTRIRPSLVLISGDMVAGQAAGVDHPAMWRGFHEAVTDRLLAAGIAVAPAPGNHDAAPGYRTDRQHYISQWTDRGRVARVRYVDGSRYPMRYSFEQGGALFVALDATAVGPLSTDQRAWVDDQLASSDAEVKIVFGHMPNHAFAVGRESETLADTHLESIFDHHDVDAYISGHHHAYYPGKVGLVRHVAMPCLGSGARRLVGSQQRSSPALVVLQIDETDIVAVEAFVAPDFRVPVRRESLPRRIGDVVRDDLGSSVR